MNNQLQGLKVLIVEDSPTQSMLLKDALERSGLVANVAKDGLEGVKKLSEVNPEVVICDIEMPSMNGYEFCKHAKSDEKFKHIPIILLTSLKEPEEVINGIEAGADSFLTKPIQTPFLLSRIHDLLESKRVRKEKEELAVFLNNKKYSLSAHQNQITDLLLSTYLNAVEKNSELETAYRSLNLKNEELKKLNELKNQFLGMAAHDLRNPLGVIKSYSDLLQQTLDNLDSKHLKMLQRIESSSAFMLELINNLLDYSVIESGTVTLHLADVDLHTLLQENIALMKNLAEQKQIVFELKIENQIPNIIGDYNKLAQVFNNLIANAIKFSHNGSSIVISLKQENNEVIIAVKDSGVGIPEEIKKNLFTPFTKGAKGTAGEKTTGLGLAIAKKIVAEHKGKIWVESTEGKGSIFYVSLPIKATAIS